MPGDSRENLRHLTGFPIKSMRQIFKTETLVYPPKANLEVLILFGKITSDPELRKMLVRGLYMNELPCSILVHNLLATEI